MIAGINLFNTPMARYRLGSILIWVGVFAWVPYIVLRVTGQSTSPLWFLPFHLIGVVGGGRLRSFDRKEMGIESAKRNKWRVFGHILIWLGVAVWGVYFYLKLIEGISVNVVNFLPYHLTGVLGGILFLIIGSLISKKENATAIG